MWYNRVMEKNTTLTEEQLNQVPKDVLVGMYMELSKNMNTLVHQIAALEEQIKILTNRSFGRKTEKASEIDGLQIAFDFCLNEAEHLLDTAEEVIRSHL